MKMQTLEKESVDWVDNDRHALFHHADFRAYEVCSVPLASQV